MFIAKYNNLIISAKETREELEQALQIMVYTSIEETDVNYVLYNGQYMTEAEIIALRKEQFNKNFFPTSLGYIRREVSMLDGTTKTFLTDMLPQLVVGFPILAYDKPDFTQEVNMVDYQKQVIVTEQFLAECKNQLIIDFYGFNPMEISSGSSEPIDGSDTVVDTDSETPSDEVEGEVA